MLIAHCMIMIKFLKAKLKFSQYKHVSENKSEVDMMDEINAVNITALNNDEKEKLRAKLVNRLNKIEVEKRVSNELMTMKEGMEKAKIINMLNKMDIEKRVNKDLKVMEEEEDLAKHINKMNKLSIEITLLDRQPLEEEENFSKKLRKPQDSSQNKENEILETVNRQVLSDDQMAEARKINQLHKSEVENRLARNLENCALEEEQAKLINKVNKLDIEDKLVRNMISLEKDIKMDDIVNSLGNDNIDQINVISDKIEIVNK